MATLAYQIMHSSEACFDQNCLGWVIAPALLALWRPRPINWALRTSRENFIALSLSCSARPGGVVTCSKNSWDFIYTCTAFNWTELGLVKWGVCASESSWRPEESLNILEFRILSNIVENLKCFTICSFFLRVFWRYWSVLILLRAEPKIVYRWRSCKTPISFVTLRFFRLTFFFKEMMMNIFSWNFHILCSI